MYQFGQKAAVFDGDKVLALKQSGYAKFGAGKWDLPGGKVNDGEKPHDAILRELLEETGLKLAGGDGLVASIYRRTETGEDWIILVHPFKYDGQPITLSGEHTAFKWTSVEELDNREFKHKGTTNAVRKLYEKLYKDR